MTTLKTNTPTRIVKKVDEGFYHRERGELHRAHGWKDLAQKREGFPKNAEHFKFHAPNQNPCKSSLAARSTRKEIEYVVAN